MNDLVALAGIATFLLLGFWGALATRITVFRIGSVATSLAACVGCAYAGWKPFFGGSHEIGIYFGCLMLTFGSVGWLLFRGLSTAFPPKHDSISAPTAGAR